ncbi:hypothetical protein EWM64_g7023 [Hericium alpestre]|uniref:Uncharacterized protein n=1 Tax=Hericium alpestre TaxID=135208 RepID=A0A4Y9ZU06_9AGAM|nr:hypothetical protein EWM64_g7023 [Hericium alpestre]
MAPSTPQIPSRSHSRSSMHVKRVTLTSKKNWWMVELDEEEEEAKDKPPSQAFADEDVYRDTAYPSRASTYIRMYMGLHTPYPFASPHPARFPSRIPAILQPPTAPICNLLLPNADILRRAAEPNVLPRAVLGGLDLGTVQSNAADVATQFLAELRVYTSVAAALFRMILTPVDTVKTTLQTQGQRGWGIIQKRIQMYGIVSLFYGAWATAAATFVGHYPWFGTYNYLQGALPPAHTLLQTLARQAFIGFVASVVSDSISNSLRVVKTYRQVNETRIGWNQKTK